MTMVVLGDSTALGVGAESLEATLPYRVANTIGRRVSVENLAVSGTTLGEVLDEQVPRIVPGADIVIVSVTANDATHDTSESDLRLGLRALLAALDKRGAGRIVMSTTPNFRTTPALPWPLNRLFERRARSISATIRQEAARHPRVRLAEFFEEGTLREGQYAADGFHPNRGGYVAWARLFAQAAR